MMAFAQLMAAAQLFVRAKTQSWRKWSLRWLWPEACSWCAELGTFKARWCASPRSSCSCCGIAGGGGGGGGDGGWRRFLGEGGGEDESGKLARASADVEKDEEVEVEGNDDGGGGAAEGGNEEAADAAARSKFKVSPWLWWFRPWNAAMAGTEFEFVLMLEDMPSLSSWRKGEG